MLKLNSGFSYKIDYDAAIAQDDRALVLCDRSERIHRLLPGLSQLQAHYNNSRECGWFFLLLGDLALAQQVADVLGVSVRYLAAFDLVSGEYDDDSPFRALRTAFYAANPDVTHTDLLRDSYRNDYEVTQLLMVHEIPSYRKGAKASRSRHVRNKAKYA